jgi:SpoIID/LytB domain protein
MRFLIFLFIFLSELSIGANTFVRIGLYHKSEVESISIKSAKNIRIQNLNHTFHFDELNTDATISVRDKKLSFQIDQHDLFLSKRLHLHWEENIRLHVKLKSGKRDSLSITGKLELTYYMNALKIILITDEDSYLEGVVAAEIGKFKPHETNKAQAVIARTYYYSQKTKHRSDGFDCCDGTHCQAYKGRPSDDNQIKLAVEETHGIILIYPGIANVEALYHANCGGNTCSTDLVWSTSIPYLIPVKDTFCLNSPGALWERKFDSNYVIQKLNLDNPDALLFESYLCTSPEKRKNKIVINQITFSTVELRSLFELKSAWFYLDYHEGLVSIRGKGYGHGVGLCQEGAIKMGESGYSMSEILGFYYPKLHLNQSDIPKMDSP